MALSISPTHDVLAYSPHARFAVLPDLPYAQTRPRGRSEITSPRGSPQVMSAPTSPLNRPHYPAVSPLTHISPISLPASTSHASASTPSCSRPEPLRLPASVPTLTPQQMAKSQAAQAINSSNSQSYFPPQRRSPPGSSASLPSSMTFVPPAPLSSTNLASLAKGAVDVPGRSRARSRPRAPAGLPEEPGSGSETERGGGSDSDVTVVDHRRIGKASYSQTDIPALRRRLTSNAEAGPSGTSHYQQSKQQGNGTSGKIRDTDTITLPRPVGGRKTPPKTPPSRPLSLNQAHGSLPASGPSQPISPGKSPRSRSHTSLASLRRSPTTSPKNALHPLRRSPTSSPRGSSHSLTPLTPVTPYSLSPNLRGAGQATSSDADGEDDSQTDEMTDSSVSFRTRSHSGLRRRSAPTGSASGLGLSLGHDTGVDLAKASDELLPEAIERLYRSSSLLYLRILSIMPSCWGTSVLCHALVTGSIRYDVWPWGADFSREALYQLSHGGGEYEGDWKRAIRGDLILCIAWAILTGHFCFRFTTGLTYRWRTYYDLLPVLVRLLALQALCWPATYITLSYLGPSQPLFAWAVIGVSTGITYAVIMWLASNVLPDPDDDPRSRSRSRTRASVDTDGDRTPPAAGGLRLRTRSGARPSVFPEWGEALLISPPLPPAHLSWWERLNYKRRWDWDSVAREVGWKVGGLLLLTSAWVFWQVHIGWLVRPDHLVEL